MLTASTKQAAVSVMPAGKVKNATYHTHTVKTPHAVAMASVLTARVSVHLASEELTVIMVSTSSLSTAFHVLRSRHFVVTLSDIVVDAVWVASRDSM